LLLFESDAIPQSIAMLAIGMPPMRAAFLERRFMVHSANTPRSVGAPERRKVGALLPDRSMEREWQVSAEAAIHALGGERLALGREPPLLPLGTMHLVPPTLQT
jgi:hypothetical protein